MTLEEVRKSKRIAEDAIVIILNELRKRTGLCAIEVRLGLVDVSSFSSVKKECAVSHVIIEMESI